MMSLCIPYWKETHKTRISRRSKNTIEFVKSHIALEHFIYYSGAINLVLGDTNYEENSK